MADSRSTRDRILEVAEELIARHGMQGLRLKEVAERVGIQPPSVFAHFDGREAIGDAVAVRVMGALTVVIEKAVSSTNDLEAMLRIGVRAMAEHLYDHPGHTRLLLRDMARTRSGQELAVWSPDVPRLEADIDALLAAGAAQGVFRPIPPATFLPVLEGALCSLIGWAGFAEDGRPVTPLSREEVADRIVDLAWAYVRAQGDEADTE